MARSRARAFLAFSLVFLLVAASTLMLAPSRPTRAQTAQAVPEQFIYWNVLHHVAHLKHKADDAQLQGKDRSSLRHIVHKKIGLNDDQGAILEQVALQCEADVKLTDEKAAVIMRKMRGQFVGGIVPKGFSPPIAPYELTRLQAERDATIFRCRDTLRGLLGEQAFATFDDFARNIAARTPPRRMKPAIPAR